MIVEIILGAIVVLETLYIQTLRDERQFQKECLERRDEDINYYQEREKQLLKCEKELLKRLENEKMEIRWSKEL